MLSFKELFNDKKSKHDFSEVFIDKATFYACEDADFTLRLYNLMKNELEANELNSVFHHIEMPLIPVLADMELRGIKVDMEYFKELNEYFSKEIASLKHKIYEISGEEFNINPTQQLAKILFEKLMLPRFGKTAKGTNFSTNIKVLEKLASSKK